MSNRILITRFLIDSLKIINGGVSPYDSSYTFNTNLHENVYIGQLYIDEINDFPSIYISSGEEFRTYNTSNLIEAEVLTTIRCYSYSGDTFEANNNIIKDVEHVIYNMKIPVEFQAQDVTIRSVLIDTGLLAPYGMAEIFLTTKFEIFNN